MFNKFKMFLGLLLMLVLFLPALAHASSNGDYSITTATLGDKDAGGDYRVWFTNDGIQHYAQDTGIQFPYGLPASTGQTLTAAQSGQTFVLNNGNGVYPGGAIMTLPTSIVKLEYTFIIDVAGTMRIKPQAGDIINFSSNVAGSKVKNTSAAIGDSIEVFCATAGQWSIKSRTGTWATDNNP